MKKVIVLTITGLVAASLTAQTVKSPLNEFMKRYVKRPVHFAQQQMITDHELRAIPFASKKHAAPLSSSYDIKQKLDSVISQDYDVNSEAWGSKIKYVYVYNAYGKFKTMTSLVTGPNNNTWYNADKTEYFYDDNRNLIRVITSGWDNGSSRWLARVKSEYTYNDDQRMTQALYYSPNQQGNGWEYTYREDFSLDDDNNLTLETDYLWDEDANDWYKFDKVEYSYDGNGNMIRDIYYFWSGTEWVLYDKEELTFDNRNYLTSLVGYHWDDQWTNISKFEYTYNDDGIIVLDIESHWDGQWVNREKWVNAPESNGDVTRSYNYCWDTTEGKWYNNVKVEFTYNDTWSWENLVFPVVYDEIYYYQMFGVPYRGYEYGYGGDIPFNHMLTKTIGYASETQDFWYPGHRDYYYYSEINLTAIAEDPETDLSLFPNPAVDKFIIRCPEFKRGKAKVELYDLTGKKYLEKEISAGYGEFTVDVHNLKNGLYFCRIQTEKGSVTKKLIIRK